jgi:hypothetical protein
MLTAAVAGLALTLSATADAKDRPISDHERSITIAPLKLINPLALVEYEQSLSDKSSFTLGAGYGRFNSLWLRIVNSAASAAGASYTMSEIAATGAYNYYFKNFNRGWYTGAGVEYSMYTPSVSAGDESASAESFSNMTIGPHIGWKVATEGGFTFSWDYGLGYQVVFGDTSGSIAPSLNTNRASGMGSLNMGWSF